MVGRAADGTHAHLIRGADVQSCQIIGRETRDRDGSPDGVGKRLVFQFPFVLIAAGSPLNVRTGGSHVGDSQVRGRRARERRDFHIVDNGTGLFATAAVIFPQKDQLGRRGGGRVLVRIGHHHPNMHRVVAGEVELVRIGRIRAVLQEIGEIDGILGIGFVRVSDIGGGCRIFLVARGEEHLQVVESSFTAHLHIEADRQFRSIAHGEHLLSGNRRETADIIAGRGAVGGHKHRVVAAAGIPDHPVSRAVTVVKHPVVRSAEIRGIRDGAGNHRRVEGDGGRRGELAATIAIDIHRVGRQVIEIDETESRVRYNLRGPRRVAVSLVFHLVGRNRARPSQIRGVGRDVGSRHVAGRRTGDTRGGKLEAAVLHTSVGMEIEGQRTVGGDHRGDGARAPEIAKHGVVGVRSVENAKIIATAFRDIRARDGDRNAGGLGIENQRVVAACTVVARGTAVVVNRQGASRQRVRAGSSHIVSARGDGDRADPKALLATTVCLHVEIVGDGRKSSERERIGTRRFQRPGRGTLDVAGRAILDVPRGGRAVLRPRQRHRRRGCGY